MSAYLQHNIDREAPTVDTYHYDPEQNLLYLSFRSGTESYTIVGSPEQIGTWIGDVADTAKAHVARAVADRNRRHLAQLFEEEVSHGQPA